MYKNLECNVPKYMMRFKDFKDDFEEVYLTNHQEYSHLVNYMKHFDVEKYIQYNTAALNVEVNHGDESPKHWKVTTASSVGGEEAHEYFDYVIVGNGHNSVPYYGKDR
mmetsp:Transcript_37836/g.43474  ORF Transcript_37836/g.43474 Transcript_37836/m.43474 type:complete len:108 (+) Transcript_37836:209-532(+)